MELETITASRECSTVILCYAGTSLIG